MPCDASVSLHTMLSVSDSMPSDASVNIHRHWLLHFPLMFIVLNFLGENFFVYSVVLCLIMTLFFNLLLTTFLSLTDLHQKCVQFPLRMVISEKFKNQVTMAKKAFFSSKVLYRSIIIIKAIKVLCWRHFSISVPVKKVRVTISCVQFSDNNRCSVRF